MLLLLIALEAILGVLLFSGVLTLHWMLIAGAVLAFLWWGMSVGATARERRRAQ